MKTLIPAIALGLAMMLNGCAEAPVKSAAQKPAAPGLKFSYPTAQRNVVDLTAPEREYLLNEMRYYLDMLWVATDALSHDNFDTVAKVARARLPTMSAIPMPPTLEAKLPKEYLALWRSNNEILDQVAATAEQSRNTAATLDKVGVLLQRCNECHAIFQYHAR